jgi:hypothetical protein
MWAFFAASVDLVHALSMAAWVLGMPLLFCRRWPRLTRAYAVYAVAFVILNQLSLLVLGECFVSQLAQACWRAAGKTVSDEWLTVRLSEAIFRLSPTHEFVKTVTKALVLITAGGVLVSLRSGSGREELTPPRSFGSRGSGRSR